MSFARVFDAVNHAKSTRNPALFASSQSIRNSAKVQKEQGVAKFEYNPADARWPSLFDLLRPLEDLEEMLLRGYAGRTVGMNELFERHSIGKPYVKKNYREVLCRMEQEGKLRMEPPCPPRRRGTIGENVKITFPVRPV